MAALSSPPLPLPSPTPSSSKLNPSPSSSFALRLPPRPRGLFHRLPPPPPPHRVHAMSSPQLQASVVTKGSWDKLILNSDVPVLVEFYASWCGPCRMVHRIMDEIAEEYEGKIKCFVLNTDNDLEVAQDYDIKAVPVVLLFKNGKKCESVVGTMPKDFYVAAINRVMES